MKLPSLLLPRTTILMFVLLLVSVAPIQSKTVDYDIMSKTELQQVVADLELGFGSYVIGKTLTAEQLEIAEKNRIEKAYAGMKNFKDGDIFVTVDKDSNAVIVLYKRNKKANKSDFKVMISDLMMRYGEPTAEAHGKTIYWNYNEDGVISEELYRTIKAQGKLDKLTVLATVKFSSSENVETMTDMIQMMDKKNQQSEEIKKVDITSDNYVMIQSDILSRKYLKQ